MALFNDGFEIKNEYEHFYHSEEAVWSCRSPPTGLMPHEFRLCKHFQKYNTCRLGAHCVEAHGIKEFNEWFDRWKIRQEKVVGHFDNNPNGQTFLKKLQVDCSTVEDSDSLFTGKLPGVLIDIETEEHVILSSKPANLKWTFRVKSSEPLQHVALLQDNHREYFSIQKVELQNNVKEKIGIVLESDQEWDSCSRHNTGVLFISVKFKANIYGSFSQSVVFNFGSKPFLSRNLKVDVYPVDQGLELSEDGNNLIVSSEQQWTDQNAKIIRLPPSVWEENSEILKRRYPQPGPELKFPLALKDRDINPSNYKEQMHALLDIEELAQSKILSNFNLTGNVILTSQYILSPGPLSTAKYCNGPNELFAKLDLNVKISEDTPAGRLILNNCHVALISFGLDSQGK